ncbi:MAG TPA: chromate transporter [Actinocrinis sp.]|jgi:chromate transporter
MAQAADRGSDPGPDEDALRPSVRVPLAVIAREWGRIGVTGFGGPPAHIALLRRLCVQRRAWIPADEFEDAIATVSLLPGPASTQLAIWCGWRLRGRTGALVAGFCFIVPGLVVILALSAVFLAKHPPDWILGAAAGAGSAVPAVAVHAAAGLAPASWKRIRNGAGTNAAAGTTAAAEHITASPGRPAAQTGSRSRRAASGRWIAYALIGGTAAATLGPYLVLFLLFCGLIEIAVRVRSAALLRTLLPLGLPTAAAAALAAAPGGIGAVAWIAFKVGALSYGGGFVIIPLMQHDAVNAYHWLSNAQFLDAVALGQVTPGPVVLTVGVVGYAAAGPAGALLAVLIAFSPSFLFVLLGGRHFDRLRGSDRIQAFLTGAGPAVIGAIAGAAIPLALALGHGWQYPLLAAAGVWLLAARRGVVSALLLAAACGLVASLAGLPVG